ncbi:hypothetical protein ANN_16870 [Periplaneta americana]|uniref:Uncharacterized protein n=1 Tax=Periplaneta americana TaxID=6978 RepID=A0ABQ8SRA7_PERAM|nr:hypothetical protein ANN_16870 [Periplaneta americana]
MTGLCEGGNEPPGSLKANILIYPRRGDLKRRQREREGERLLQQLRRVSRRRHDAPVSMATRSSQHQQVLSPSLPPTPTHPLGHIFT